MENGTQQNTQTTTTQKKQQYYTLGTKGKVKWGKKLQQMNDSTQYTDQPDMLRESKKTACTGQYNQEFNLTIVLTY